MVKFTLINTLGYSLGPREQMNNAQQFARVRDNTNKIEPISSFCLETLLKDPSFPSAGFSSASSDEFMDFLHRFSCNYGFEHSNYGFGFSLNTTPFLRDDQTSFPITEEKKGWFGNSKTVDMGVRLLDMSDICSENPFSEYEVKVVPTRTGSSTGLWELEIEVNPDIQAKNYKWTNQRNFWMNFFKELTRFEGFLDSFAQYAQRDFLQAQMILGNYELTCGQDAESITPEEYGDHFIYDIRKKQVKPEPRVTKMVQAPKKILQAQPEQIPEPKEEPVTKSTEIDYKRPSTLEAAVRPYVVGQDRAMSTLAEQICDHVIRINLPEETRAKIKKDNVLMIGSTGTGKTYITKQYAAAIDVPFADFGAAQITADGYVGESIRSIFERLIDNAGSIEAAQKGIIFIDEFDKLAAKDEGSRDIRGADVQNQLLRVFEGESVETKYGIFQTNDVLIICAGAYAGLGDIVRARTESQSGVGFDRKETTKPVSDTNKHITPADLEAYGFKREISGRFSDTVAFDLLTQDDLVQIMKVKDSYIDGEQLRWNAGYDIDLQFTDGAYHAIAAEAISQGTGARDIQRVVTTVLRGMRESQLIEDRYHNQHSIVIVLHQYMNL